MVGNAQNPIQIDEARFAGRRKYNRGRLLAGDAPPSLRDINVEVINNRNHGARVDGLWIGGSIKSISVQNKATGVLIWIISYSFKKPHIYCPHDWMSFMCS
ncbi:hypothetical protein ACI65C_000127 [Semiaphis heraclei]